MEESDVLPDKIIELPGWEKEPLGGKESKDSQS